MAHTLTHSRDIDNTHAVMTNKHVYVIKERLTVLGSPHCGGVQRHNVREQERVQVCLGERVANSSRVWDALPSAHTPTHCLACYLFLSSVLHTQTHTHSQVIFIILWHGGNNNNNVWTLPTTTICVCIWRKGEEFVAYKSGAQKHTNPKYRCMYINTHIENHMCV